MNTPGMQYDKGFMTRLTEIENELRLTLNTLAGLRSGWGTFNGAPDEKIQPVMDLVAKARQNICNAIEQTYDIEKQKMMEKLNAKKEE